MEWELNPLASFESLQVFETFLIRLNTLCSHKTSSCIALLIAATYTMQLLESGEYLTANLHGHFAIPPLSPSPQTVDMTSEHSFLSSPEQDIPRQYVCSRLQLYIVGVLFYLSLTRTLLLSQLIISTHKN